MFGASKPFIERRLLKYREASINYIQELLLFHVNSSSNRQPHRAALKFLQTRIVVFVFLADDIVRYETANTVLLIERPGRDLTACFLESIMLLKDRRIWCEHRA